MIKEFMGKAPEIKNAAFVAEDAAIIGDAVFMSGSSVWFNAVVRADVDKITVGENSNIQDNCTVHCTEGYPVVIGKNVTIGHNAVVHGCTVGDNCLIGMNATILDGAVIGKNSIVGAGALVTENKKFPDNSLIIGVPAKAVRVLDESAVNSVIENARHYTQLAEEYSK